MLSCERTKVNAAECILQEDKNLYVDLEMLISVSTFRDKEEKGRRERKLKKKERSGIREKRSENEEVGEKRSHIRRWGGKAISVERIKTSSRRTSKFFGWAFSMENFRVRQFAFADPDTDFSR